MFRNARIVTLPPIFMPRIGSTPPYLDTIGLLEERSIYAYRYTVIYRIVEDDLRAI